MLDLNHDDFQISNRVGAACFDFNNIVNVCFESKHVVFAKVYVRQQDISCQSNELLLVDVNQKAVAFCMADACYFGLTTQFVEHKGMYNHNSLQKSLCNSEHLSNLTFRHCL